MDKYVVHPDSAEGLGEELANGTQHLGPLRDLHGFTVDLPNGRAEICRVAANRRLHHQHRCHEP